MENWHELTVGGIGRIERIASIFQVWAPSHLPFPCFKVKVVERADGSFLGVPNVAFCSTPDRPEWISGLGESVDDALADTLRYFLRTIPGDRELTDGDFTWSDPLDF